MQQWSICYHGGARLDWHQKGRILLCCFMVTFRFLFSFFCEIPGQLDWLFKNKRLKV
jgi:hypothetical protein